MACRTRAARPQQAQRRLCAPVQPRAVLCLVINHARLAHDARRRLCDRRAFLEAEGLCLECIASGAGQRQEGEGQGRPCASAHKQLRPAVQPAEAHLCHPAPLSSPLRAPDRCLQQGSAAGSQVSFAGRHRRPAEAAWLLAAVGPLAASPTQLALTGTMHSLLARTSPAIAHHSQAPAGRTPS